MSTVHLHLEVRSRVAASFAQEAAAGKATILRPSNRETAEKVSSAFPKLPIILYTVYGFDAMIAGAKKHGIREVIDKTASGERLLEAIEKHLGKASTSLQFLDDSQPKLPQRSPGPSVQNAGD